MTDRASHFAASVPGSALVAVHRGIGGMLAASRRLARLRPHCIYVLDVNLATAAPVLLTRWLRRRPLVLDIGDDVVQLSRNMGRPWPLVVLAGLLERALLRSASVIVVRGRGHRQVLARRGIRRPVMWIPDGVETRRYPYRGLAHGRLRRLLGGDGPLLVGVVGSIHLNPQGFCYGWELVEALRLLPDIDVRGVVVGSGTGVTYLKDLAERHGLTGRLRFLPRVRDRNLPLLLSAVDVWLSTQSNDDAGRVRMTGKLATYLAAGVYVVATDVGEASELVPSVGTVLPYAGVIDRTYPARLAAVLTELAQNRGLLEKGRGGIARARDLDYGALRNRVIEAVARAMGQRPTSEPGSRGEEG